MTNQMTDRSGQAWERLVELMAAIEQDWWREIRQMPNPDDRAEARMFALNALHHALEFWSQADPERPWFYRWFSPTKKLLGDNPDAVYYGTVIHPDRDYVIRGNLAGAVYTSFTVEQGTVGGSMSTGLGATLNDDEIQVHPDGSYELHVSQKPQPGNWLALKPDSGSITTRHYFEWDRPAATDPTLHVPLSIQPVPHPGPPTIPDDESCAQSLERVATFLRSVTVDWPAGRPENVPEWSSIEPNRFTNPPLDAGNRAIGYAAADNAYRSTRYQLTPDQALEIRGRFPQCRFANVVLNNRFIQTPPYRHRRVSLNRRQTTLEADGSFRMILAHRDPGVPNWLDTAGAPTGTVFWRYLLPTEQPEQLQTQVLPIDEVRATR
ncbi:DUF1214 domain-containing protein [Candidatus Poriferisocius sp.]|uniref:DUF1214 domain-containing protein n=1 Tax=Candidatus Poriferisocius sp. TaxID=3101276 RepID=UPI003B01C78C